MKATGFEFRHPLLIHEVIVDAALFTYLVLRGDALNLRFGGDPKKTALRWTRATSL
ncbi:hypothetical protein ACPOL_1538 [Acidisarcina polymorpha]|uniref:Uncharacterized protein n=1 Tax=Acidisarcina polymorpha TaxID=2211140 RepID=A0A2Z5FWJ6_9BACT|nr:hypothetical protein [Acidisarcina polymorpha]AXC10884.1 hypothetical protein ACPOL_1538 [Acidisarcina polymorpha]